VGGGAGGDAFAEGEAFIEGESIELAGAADGEQPLSAAL